MRVGRLRGRGAFARLAGRKRARAFVTRPDFHAIEDAKVSVAHNFETPEQRQTQCTADSAGNFGDELAAAERCDMNLDRCFLFASFHWLPRLSGEASACNRMLRHFQIANVLINAPVTETLPVTATPPAIRMAPRSQHPRPARRSSR